MNIREKVIAEAIRGLTPGSKAGIAGLGTVGLGNWGVYWVDAPVPEALRMLLAGLVAALEPGSHVVIDGAGTVGLDPVAGYWVADNGEGVDNLAAEEAVYVLASNLEQAAEQAAEE